MKGIAITFVLFASANALCPNDCSGHGECSKSSHCGCYHNWMGADCAQRVCTFGRAFVDSPWGDLDGDGAFNPARAFSPTTNFKVHGIDEVQGNIGEMGFTEYGYARESRTVAHDEAHFYRECSNKGLCDRETGLCECFPGYEGSGCRRTSCPDDCNGNGVCRTIDQSNRAWVTGYSAWDHDKTQLCECDAGWTGPSCALRSCPKGADPVLYNHKVVDSVQGIYFRTFAADKLEVATSTRQQEFLKDKPSKVFFTVTFTDEYNDEWTTSLMSIDYTTFCETSDDGKHGICLSTPTLGMNKAATAAPTYGDTRSTLQRVSQALNNSLLALPTNAIETSYVWSAANPLFATCDGKTANAEDNDLRKDIQACTNTKTADLKLKAADLQYYPWPTLDNECTAGSKVDANGVCSKGTPIPSADVQVESLEFRLDTEILKQIDINTAAKQTIGENTIDFDGTDTEHFGLALFVRLPPPGVHQPLQVRYFYNSESSVGTTSKGYSQIDGQTSGFTDDGDLFRHQDLVIIQDMQPKRMWNKNDGESTKDFSKVTTKEMPYCSNRGICDHDSGICNCFSGYTGLRCDTQNAVTYSY